MVKKRNRKQTLKYQNLLPTVIDLKAVHPFWGARRITAYLKLHHDKTVNHKGIELLLKNANLTVPRKQKLLAKRTSNRGKPITCYPNWIWGTDMTKTMTQSGWCYVHVVLDWGTKKLLSAYASLSSTSRDWILTLDKAVNLQYPEGIAAVDEQERPKIVSDNGCQPTSKAYQTYEKQLGLRHIFTSYSNPKGDADTERVIRTLKEDLLWIREFVDVVQLQEELDKWVNDYNYKFPHSSLANCTPADYEERCFNGTEPLNTRARKILDKKSLFSLFERLSGCCNAPPL